jgi:hypothetical protein
MKAWHCEHAEKAIIRFVRGVPEDASGYERRIYKKYGTVANCIRQLEYDMHHGVQKDEIIEIIRKIGQNKKYTSVRSHPEARMRLEELESYLSGGSKGAERFDWIQHAQKEEIKFSEGL